MTVHQTGDVRTYLSLRETLLKKGSSDGGGPLCHGVTSPRTAGSHPQTPFLKLSVLIFPHIGRSPCIKTCFFYLQAPYIGKIKIKSLWKGVQHSLIVVKQSIINNTKLAFLDG